MSGWKGFSCKMKPRLFFLFFFLDKKWLHWSKTSNTIDTNYAGCRNQNLWLQEKITQFCNKIKNTSLESNKTKIELEFQKHTHTHTISNPIEQCFFNFCLIAKHKKSAFCFNKKYFQNQKHDRQQKQKHGLRTLHPGRPRKRVGFRGRRRRLAGIRSAVRKRKR